MLEYINDPNDIKQIQPEDYKLLAKDIRRFLLRNVSRTGGHLASNLGIVELTMALHLVLDFPKDQLIFDVGHQSYVHKILTGRKNGFENLRQFHGMSGFPKRKESDCDAFHSGHSSMSLSAALGMVTARDINHTDETIVAVIGDGALSGGMAYEALNNMARLRKEKKNLIIILNDNKMSIAENVGGMSAYLNKVRTRKEYVEFKGNVEQSLLRIPGIGKELTTILKKSKDSIKQLFVPGMFFEDMGITYLGPVDGHDLKTLTKTLNEAKRVNHAVLVHVVTKKGKGYLPAETNPSKFHGTGPFDVTTGETIGGSGKDSYTDIFSKVLADIGKKDKKVVAITAAMADGTGLSRFAKLFPERFFDVGIAEEHAMTFAAGLAAGGMKPVFAVYSSFLQRAFDQTIHDVCLQNLPVVIAVDRAGLVGSDGETHQGVFDLSFLSLIPNLSILSPKNRWEMADMVRFAVDFQYPIALRYPRGEAYEGLKEFRAPIEYGKSELLYEESEIAVMFVGHMSFLAEQVREDLKAAGYQCSLINARFVKPLDTERIRKISENHRILVTIEENVLTGGFGEQVEDFVMREGIPLKVCTIGISDDYVEHGNVDVLRKEVGLDRESIVKKVIADDRRIKEEK